MNPSTPPHSSDLSFDTLREATRTRTPRFKNSLGQPAHNSPDGSDWSPAVWLQALVGELGEFARVRHQYERGEMSFEDYSREAAKELADVQCYLDLLAMRALDQLAPAKTLDSAQQLQLAVAGLGEYANWRKKYERGDIDYDRFVAVSQPCLALATDTLQHLPLDSSLARNPVEQAHPCGVSLGQATADKFNEVSHRVGVPVFIVDNVVEDRAPDES